MSVPSNERLSSLHLAAGQYASGAYAAALASLEKLICRATEADVEALNLAGACARRLGLIEKAEAYLSQAIAFRPEYADACSNLGNVLRDQRRNLEAEDLYRRAINLNPHHADALFQLGSLYQILGRDIEAADTYRRLLSISPSNGNALYNLGILLRKSGSYSDAIDVYQRVVDMHPAHADAYTNLGNLLADRGDYSEAAIAYTRVLALRPDAPDAHYNFGTVLEKQGKYTEAYGSYEAALRLCPSHGPAQWKCAHMRRYLCNWSKGIGGVELNEFIDGSTGHAALSPFELLCMAEATPLHQRRVAELTAQQRGYGKLAAARESVVQQRTKRLRIGYLSADFYDHATTRLLGGVLERHDRANFAIHAYSYGPCIEDSARERVVQSCEVFRELSGVSDRVAADQIAADKIDILIDLKGYTAGGRLGITARRPAPVIVSWLGYPGTLGEKALADYIIGDPIVTPLEHSDRYSEILALMPHCYQPNDDCRTTGAQMTRQEAGLPTGCFVFCCFNQSYKFTSTAFDVWCHLLRAVPGSVLWLLVPPLDAQTNLRREAVARGVDATRLIFATAMPQAQHLVRLALADLALDTFPYGSHTTGSDALWAGVPMVTLMGETFASRVASSLLHAVGLPELVTQDWRGYFERAHALATDREMHMAVREKLARQRFTTPLFDTQSFVRDLERLYQNIWQQHEDGKKTPIVLSNEATSIATMTTTQPTHLVLSKAQPVPMSLTDLLQPARTTAVVDIGANPIDGDPPYKGMLASGLCTVVGFEPQEEALAELLGKKGANERYLPYVIGSGGPQRLRVCRASGMTSLFEPDPTTLSLFEALMPLGEVVREIPVETRRLDDIAEIEHLDFLKIDIQGGELAVFQGGREKLATAVVIQTEVSFVTLYKEQPTLGDVDTELRRQGFIPHGFAAIKKWPISPCVLNNNPRQPLNQLLEADLVYVRDFSRPEKMSDEQLKHLALIAHHSYGSIDLALRCVVLLERRGSLAVGATQRYMGLINQPR